MSAEFEKIVLEKLDRIEAKLEAHDKKFEQHDKRFDAIDKKFEQYDKKFEQYDKKLEQYDKKLEQYDEKFEQHDKKFEQQEKKSDDIIETLKVSQNLLTLFEYDFNQKMQAVLDGISAINERNAKYDDMFMHFSSKLLNHETRISVLEEEQEKYNKK